MSKTQQNASKKLKKYECGGFRVTGHGDHECYDRTIAEYAAEIWNTTPYPID